MPKVFGVRPDRFDHQIEFIGAVDLAPYAVRLIRRDKLGFGEVIQTINALGVAVLHQKHRARTVFHPREQEQMIGAEVEHWRNGGIKPEAGVATPAPVAAPLRG